MPTAAAEMVPGTIHCDLPSQTWTNNPEVSENKLMNCVTWYEAMEFCIWNGGYSPTELEWHYAASKGIEYRAYPWSVPPARGGRSQHSCESPVVEPVS